MSDAWADSDLPGFGTVPITGLLLPLCTRWSLVQLAKFPPRRHVSYPPCQAG
ncbi:hypothetical protein ZHAS_00008650 [Anopheles sinensis]|uniref:Uncharacterized protein n=1 Tax=Anopheles sinensis TaxID=74873 RepID=A0A084VST8_ANOSI|nr:hypothetical protein ZHAS_00008650 [Anopheles sinensis]